MLASPPFDEVLRQAGAVITTRYGRPVPAHFGSAAGELAVCVRGVGVCDRSELSVLSFDGRVEDLSAAMIALLGGPLEEGGSVFVGNAWWCRETAARVVVVCRPDDGARLLGAMRAQAQRSPGLVARDRSHDCVAIGVVGEAAPDVLADLGVYGPDGDPRGVSPVTVGRIAGVEVLWLLESDRSALVLTPRSDMSLVWRTIDEAGRPARISCVGHEAFDRYMLLAGSRSRLTVAAPI